MFTITIRNLDDDVKARLRVWAGGRRSMGVRWKRRRAAFCGAARVTE